MGESATDKPLTNALYTAGIVEKDSTTGNDNNFVQLDRDTGVMKKFSLNRDARIIPTAGNLDNNYEWAHVFENSKQILFKKKKEFFTDGSRLPVDYCDQNPTEKVCGHYVVRAVDNILTFTLDDEGNKQELGFSTSKSCYDGIQASDTSVTTMAASIDSPCLVSNMKMRSSSWADTRTRAFTIHSVMPMMRRLSSAKVV